MNLFKNISCKKIIYLTAILLYIVLNLAYLDIFPFVHSDESWLGGLSRNIMDTGSFKSTEAFFDLKPRYPHGIKMIFHTMQIIMIKIFGYSITSLRLLSFTFGFLTLLFFFKLVKMNTGSENAAVFCTAFLAADVQFIYASHFARQEIIILFVLVYSIYYFFKHLNRHKAINSIFSGIIVGLSIGIHPNSFIISLPIAALYLYYFITKELKLQNLILYISSLAAFASFFVAFSLYLNPNFFADYAFYGNEFEVFNPITSKVGEITYFYQKLIHMVSGTYYTPDIRLQFLIFPLIITIAFIMYFSYSQTYKNDKSLPLMLSILAVNSGIILIGRFNQTSVVFQFPLFYMLLSHILMILSKKYKWTCQGLLLFLIMANTIFNLIPHTGNDYDGYLNEISSVVEKDDSVLANLNADFYFNNGRLHDYRNLAYLKENNMSFEEYIHQNGIKYIIFSEELDLIYQQSPKWDGIYGQLTYYDDMNNFLNTQCRLVHKFTNKTYGIRISEYINRKDWKVDIYQVTQK